MSNRVIFSALWGFGGSMSLANRSAFAASIASLLPSPPAIGSDLTLLDYEVSLKKGGEWVAWSLSVPQVSVDEALVTSPDVVIPTTDTVRHGEVVRTKLAADVNHRYARIIALFVGGWLKDRKPLILCGPPGSGKFVFA